MAKEWENVITPKKDNKRKAHVLEHDGGGSQTNSNSGTHGKLSKKKLKKLKSGGPEVGSQEGTQIDGKGKHGSTGGGDTETRPKQMTKKERKKLEREQREREASGVACDTSVLENGRDVEVSGCHVEGARSETDVVGLHAEAKTSHNEKTKKAKKHGKGNAHLVSDANGNDSIMEYGGDAEVDDIETNKAQKKKSKKEKRAERELKAQNLVKEAGNVQAVDVQISSSTQGNDQLSRRQKKALAKQDGEGSCLNYIQGMCHLRNCSRLHNESARLEFKRLPSRPPA